MRGRTRLIPLHPSDPGVRSCRCRLSFAQSSAGAAGPGADGAQALGLLAQWNGLRPDEDGFVPLSLAWVAL